MEETDYINVTNLAKLRIAEHTLHNVIPMDEQATLHHKTAQASVRWLIEHYEGKA